MCYLLFIIELSDWDTFIMFKNVLHIFFRQIHLFCYLVEYTKHKRIIHYLLTVPLNFCRVLVHKVCDIQNVSNAKLPLREVLTVPCKPP